jgi:hypothetical protein
VVDIGLIPDKQRQCFALLDAIAQSAENAYMQARSAPHALTLDASFASPIPSRPQTDNKHVFMYQKAAEPLGNNSSPRPLVVAELLDESHVPCDRVVIVAYRDSVPILRVHVLSAFVVTSPPRTLGRQLSGPSSYRQARHHSIDRLIAKHGSMHLVGCTRGDVSLHAH